jgi:hypothetical protein
MEKSNTKTFLSLLLSLLIVNPSGMFAASTTVVAPRSPLGSIDSYGSVRVGEILVPGETTLFAGDRVQTNNGGAVVQYRKGARVSLAAESVADFAPSKVQLEKGLMRFETSSNGLSFSASTLRLEPTTVKTIANVTLSDSKASVSVTEGTLKVMDPSGVQLASLNAGEARMFEEAPASASPAPSASVPSPAAPPQAGSSGQASSGGGSDHHWLIAAGIALAGLGVGIGALVHANDAESSANAASANATAAAASAAQAQSQVAALTTQLSALQTQAASLQAQLNASVSASNQLKALSAQLTAQVAALAQVQAQLTSLLSQIASQGGVATPAQLSQLQSLSSQESTIESNLANIGNGINTISPFRVG